MSAEMKRKDSTGRDARAADGGSRPVRGARDIGSDSRLGNFSVWAQQQAANPRGSRFSPSA